MKIMKFDLKWVHASRCELILRPDEAICLRTIFQPLLTPQRLLDGPKILKEFPWAPTGGNPLFNGTLPFERHMSGIGSHMLDMSALTKSIIFWCTLASCGCAHPEIRHESCRVWVKSGPGVRQVLKTQWMVKDSTSDWGLNGHFRTQQVGNAFSGHWKMMCSHDIQAWSTMDQTVLPKSWTLPKNKQTKIAMLSYC